MSSPILPAEGLSGLPSITPAMSITVDTAGVLAADLGAGDGAASVQAARGGPPPEVIDSILAAHELHEELCESGYQLRFFAAPDGGRTRIELHDADGNVVSLLTIAQALDIAAATPAG